MKVIKTPSGGIYKYAETVDEDELPRGYTVEDFDGLSDNAKKLIQMLKVKGFLTDIIGNRISITFEAEAFVLNNLAEGSWEL